VTSKTSFDPLSAEAVQVAMSQKAILFHECCATSLSLLTLNYVLKLVFENVPSFQPRVY